MNLITIYITRAKILSFEPSKSQTLRLSIHCFAFWPQTIWLGANLNGTWYSRATFHWTSHRPPQRLVGDVAHKSTSRVRHSLFVTNANDVVWEKIFLDWLPSASSTLMRRMTDDDFCWLSTALSYKFIKVPNQKQWNNNEKDIIRMRSLNLIGKVLYSKNLGHPIEKENHFSEWMN